MVNEHEVITLLLGLGVLAFVLRNRFVFRSQPAFRILISCFVVLLAGWFLTVAEEFVWHATLNALEHLCYAGSSVLAAFWCWKVFAREAV